MEKSTKTENIFIRDQTLFFINNNEWSDWRNKALTLKLRKKFIKIKNKKKIVKSIIITSELTYLDFLKYIGELTYKILCGGDDSLIFTVPSAVEYIHEKIEKKINEKYSGNMIRNKKIHEQKHVINDQSIIYNIRALNKKLNEKCPGCKFFEKIGNGYRLLVYTINAPMVEDGIGGRISLVPNRTILEDTMGAIIQFGKKIDRATSKNICHLQPLDQYLEKGSNKEPDFSRKIGPLWIDFEPIGYIVERDEVDIIIEDLERNFSQLIIGDMASGKTVIARNVGYKLIKKEWNVYYLSSHRIKHAQIKEILNEIVMIAESSQKSLIIIEDLHEAPSDCCNVLELIKYREIDIKLLITTRKEFLRGIYTTQERIFESYKKIILNKVNFQLIADSIITKYKKIKLSNDKTKMKSSEKEKFENYFKPYIKTLANGNFWLLIYLIEAWSPHKLIDFNLIFKKIQKDFIELEKKFRLSYDLRFPVETILLLAPFSDRNIRISKFFFEDLCIKIGIEYETILKLIDLGEIEQTESDYRLPHQSISQIYMETINYIYGNKNKISFIENLLILLKKIGYTSNFEDFELELFEAYLQSHPKDYGTIILEISNEILSPRDTERITIAPDKFKRRVGWKRLFYDEKTICSLVNVLNKENDIQNVGNFLIGLYLCNISTYLRSFIDPLQPEKPYVISEWYQEILWGFRKNDMSRDNDFLSEEEINKFIQDLDPQILALKINKEENIENICICLKGIVLSCNKKFKKIFFDNLNLSFLKSKLLNQNSYLMVVIIVHLLNSINQRISTQFKDLLIDKVKSEINISQLGNALWFLILPQYKKIYRRIVNQIDLTELISKFEKEKYLDEIDLCITCLKEFLLNNKNNAQRLGSILTSKIDAEENPGMIFKILGEIAVVNELGKNVVSDIINHMDRDLFKSKLRGEHRHSWDRFWDISEVKDASGLKLIMDKLDIWKYMTDFDIQLMNKFFNQIQARNP